MKKLLMMIGAAAVAVGAYANTWTDPITGIVWTYSTNNDGVSTVTLGGGTQSTPAASFSSSFDVNKIPWTFTDNGTTYAVTRLANYAFYTGSSDAKLTGTPTFPSTLTSFGYQAFYNKTGLNGNLVIPDACSGTIANSMFWNNRYTTAIIGSGVTAIDNQAFRANSALTAVWVKGRTTVSSGSQPVTDVHMDGPFGNGCNSLKVVLFGRNTSLSTYKENNKMFKGVPGPLIFFMPKSGASTYTDFGGDNTVTAFYGAGQDLDIEIDEQAKLLTATVASASALTNVLNAAATFKSAFGLDTRINVTNTIELASDLITVEKLANATFNSLTFKVNTQAQLDAILSVVPASVPLAIDCSDAKVELTPPIGRKIYALISDEGRNGKYRPKINGFIITFY